MDYHVYVLIPNSLVNLIMEIGVGGLCGQDTASSLSPLEIHINSRHAPKSSPIEWFLHPYLLIIQNYKLRIIIVFYNKT